MRIAAGPSRVRFLLALAAIGDAARAAGSKNVKASLLSETASLRPGQPVTLGLRLEMADGWHTYWKNPADSGLATKLTWTLPEGFTADPISWPHPERISAAAAHELRLRGRGAAAGHACTSRPAFRSGEPVRLAARADWLECKEICLPGKAELEITLPVEAAEPRPSDARAALREARAARLPGDGGAWKVRAPVGARSGSCSRSRRGAPPTETRTSSPTSRRSSSTRSRRSCCAHGGRLHARADAGGQRRPRRSGSSGVLVAESTVSGRRPIAVDAARRAAVAAPCRRDRGPRRGSTEPLAAASALAFLGGLILNLMPCVLPVLSLKVLGFVRQAGERAASGATGSRSRRACCSRSGRWRALMLALRAGGERIGWGFQLQSPAFVAVLAVLFLLIALNLLGVFEVGMSLTRARRNAVQGALGPRLARSGAALLATVVATPCTAPFMGSALGFALGQPALRVAARVHRARPRDVGALPAAVGVAAAAALRAEARAVDGRASSSCWRFPMLATVVFLAAGCSASRPASTAWPGCWPRSSRSRSGPGSTAARSQAALEAAPASRADRVGRRRWSSRASCWRSTRATRAVPRRAPAPRPTRSAGSRSRSSARDALRAQGTPVFIDFTASWCLTCQVNERVALDTPAVRATLRDARRRAAEGRLDAARRPHHRGARQLRPRRACRSTCSTAASRTRRRGCCPRC